MKFGETTLRVLVRKDYGACFDFYTEKLGLIPVWGDRNTPYTSFAAKKDAPPCFAIFAIEEMSDFEGYTQPEGTGHTDTITGIIPSEDLDADYKRLTEAGVAFLAPPRYMEEWGMRCTYFRDPEGNLFELNDASGV